MQDRVVLVSDDEDFFEFLIPKLSLRKSDEIYRFSFDEIPENLHSIGNAIFIINSENRTDKTLDLLSLIKNFPAIAFTYNYDEKFALNAFNYGLHDYILLTASNKEISAKLLSAQNALTTLKKNNIYRDLLVSKKLITENNEVFLDYCTILDRELLKLKKSSNTAVLAAISPNDKSKFVFQPYQIETAILNNIRNNDILMNFGINKYFLLLFNTNLKYAKKSWDKIKSSLSHNIYAGFVLTNNKNREQLVNEVLNKLHEEINKDFIAESDNSANLISSNFKLFKKEFNKKIDKVIAPTFFMIQQKYSNKLYGMTIEHGIGEGYGIIQLQTKYSAASFRITSPGLSKINIDIEYQLKDIANNKKLPDSKRISMEPDELEAGLLEDLLEQFITEYKNEVDYEHIK